MTHISWNCTVVCGRANAGTLVTPWIWDVFTLGDDFAQPRIGTLDEIYANTPVEDRCPECVVLFAGRVENAKRSPWKMMPTVS